MRKLFFTLIIMIVNIQVYAQSKFVPLKIIIIYSNLNLETVFRIDCGMLEDSKYIETRELKITKAKIALEIQNLLQKNKRLNEIKGLDVRAKLVLVYSKRRIEYCFNGYGLFEKDVIIYKNERLLNFLISLNPNMNS